jgi:hypothetical protein
MSIKHRDCHYTLIPAQPGWEVILLWWPNHKNGKVDDYEIDRAPVVAWEVRSEPLTQTSHDLFSYARPIWVGGQDLGDPNTYAIVDPNGAVYSTADGGDRFASISLYAVWDWIRLAQKDNDQSLDGLVMVHAERYKDEISQLRCLVKDAA